MVRRRTGSAGIRRAVAALAPAAVGATLVAACGPVAGLSGGTESDAHTATVAVLVPDGGDGDVNSAGVVAAVEAAVGTTTADLDGWDVTVELVADGEDEDATGAALRDLLDDDLVAVVGGLTRATVRAAQPVLDAHDVVFVSPADVVAAHTRGADPAAPLRPYPSYFRTAVTDVDPAVEAIRYAAAVEGVETMTVLDTDGGGEPFRGADAIEAARLEVVDPVADENEDADEDGDEADGAQDEGSAAPTGPVADAADLRARVDAAVDTGADGVYVAAAPGRVDAVLRRLAAIDSDVTVVGGAAFDADAAPDPGDFSGTILRGLPPELPTTMDVVPDGLDSALDGAGPGRYGAAAYDAGFVVGTVLSSCLPSATSASDARTGCLGEMDQSRVTGLTGEIVFDAYGERAGATVTVETVRDGSWASVVGD